MRISDEQAAQILTVGQAVDFVLASAETTRRRRRAQAAMPSDREPRPRRRPCRAAPELLDELPEDLAAPGLHPCVVDHAPLGLLRAAGLPRRQRAGARGDLAPVSAAGGRSLRPRAADQDPGPGGVRPLLSRGRRATRACPERLSAAAPAGGGVDRAGARSHRAGARVGDRGGDRRLLSRLRLRAHGRGGGRGVRARDRGRARASGRLQVRAAGAARAQGRAGHLRRGRRGGPAARPGVLGQRHDRRRRGRPRAGTQQEGRRAGGRAAWRWRRCE